MSAKTFKAKLGGDTGEAPAVEIPFDVKAIYGSARPKVCVTVNGVTLRTTVAVYGGISYIGFNKETREAAGIEIGKTITVTVEPDTAPRIVDVPADLQRALAKNAAARKTFESLSYSHRKEHAQWVASAKKEETRARRVARVIEMLKG
ncbi:MAG TPA: YdeI/OmpD-associated family protein [Vicinamibacterales bacterium]